ncbi:MAG: PKD domain-containing protein, partial [Candidatus Lutacidiplasmatales archaeon]
PPRQMADLVYSPPLGELVLFGGATGSYVPLNDTWVYKNQSWSKLGLPPMPALAGAAMDYVPEFHGIVMSAGQDPTGAFNTNTYLFNRTGWTSLGSVGAPHNHSVGIGVYDPVDHEFVVAGGLGDASSGAVTGITDLMVVANASVPSQADLGSAIWANDTGVGANGTFNVTWEWGDGSARSTSPDAQHRYALPGTYSVNLTVEGPASSTLLWRSSVEVRADPTASLEASCLGADVGIPASFLVTVNGGWAPYSYHWNWGDGLTSSSSLSVHNYSASGSATVALTVTDAVGESANASTAVAINATPQVAIVRVPPVDVGVPFDLAADASAGTPPFSYNWTSSSGNLIEMPSGSFSTDAFGALPVQVNVTDSCGGRAIAMKTLSAELPPELKVDGPKEVMVGATSTWSVNVTFGSAPFNFTWVISDGASSRSAQITHAVNVPGRYWINATVIDAAGGVSNVSWNLTVNPVPGGPGGSGSPASVPAWQLGLAIGLVVIGVVAGGAGFVLRSRRLRAR